MSKGIYNSLRATYRKIVSFKPHKFSKKTQESSLSFRDEQNVSHRLKTKVFSLKPKDYIDLGINPRFYIPGLEVHVMDTPNYAKLCEISGREAKDTGGFYPLSGSNEWGKEEEMVTGGKQTHLSQRSRRMALKEDFLEVSLLHELLHDIYLGGGLSLEQREGFVKIVMAETRRLLINAPESEEARLLTNIGEACRVEYGIDDIKHLLDINQTTREHRIFAGEVFSHIGEIYLKYKGIKSPPLPENIELFFDRIGLSATLRQKMKPKKSFMDPMPLTPIVFTQIRIISE